jgi:hypothetical protein
MTPKKSPRKSTPIEVETSVLAKSARRCALCFHFEGDLREKHGQIAHLDGDPSNSSEDNLAFMCLTHHSLFDSKTSQHKNYTRPEAKTARTKLYDLVAEGKHLTPATAQPYLQAEADKKILRDFLEVVPSNGAIAFLRVNNFAGSSFDWKELKDITNFCYKRNGPDHEFLDTTLEAARQRFRARCNDLLAILALNTFRTQEEGYSTVPPEWEYEDPQRFNSVVKQIHAEADSVCRAYDKVVRLARRKLAV